MFSSFKRKNYIFFEEVKTAVLTEIPVALLEIVEHGSPSPICVNFGIFYKDIKVTSGLKYPKCIWRHFGFFFFHFMIFAGLANII